MQKLHDSQFDTKSCDYLAAHYTYEFQGWMGKAFIKNYGPTVQGGKNANIESGANIW